MDNINKPVFNNVHNKMYMVNNDVKWDSRACAVVCHVWFIKSGVPYVLIGKRGQVMDNPNKWNIPCGYLDWNENLQQAMFREVWEETGLDLNKYLDHQTIYSPMTGQPWLVYSEPLENRQNIAMHMGMVVDIGSAALPELSLANMEKNESTGAYFKSIHEVECISEVDWAFNHIKRVIAFKKKIISILNRYQIIVL